MIKPLRVLDGEGGIMCTGRQSNLSACARGLQGGSRVRHETGHAPATCARVHEAGGHVTRSHVTG
eukprot:1220273-Rhodomonas_salina.1